MEIVGLVMVVGASVVLPFMPTARAADFNVYAVNYQFLPGTVNINAGDTVVWTNNVSTPHTVTSTTGAWPQINLNSQGSTGSHTFLTAATYNYYCAFHTAQGMTGTVVVTGVIPEFSDGLFVIVGLAVIVIGLMATRRIRD